MPIKFDIFFSVAKAFKLDIARLLIVGIKMKVHVTRNCKMNSARVSYQMVFIHSNISWFMVISWGVDFFCTVNEKIRNPEIDCFLKRLSMFLSSYSKMRGKTSIYKPPMAKLFDPNLYAP